MASIILRPGGWYLRDRLMRFDPKVAAMVKKDVWMRLGTVSKRVANRRLQEYLASKPLTEALRTDIRISDLVELVRERKAKDGRTYFHSDQYYLNRIEGRFGQDLLGDLTADRLREWQIEMEAEVMRRSPDKAKLSQATVSKYLRGLRAMIRWAMKTGRYVGSNPFDGFVVPPEGRPRDVIAEEDQVKRIHDACSQLRRGDVFLGQRSNALDNALLADIVEVTLSHGLRLGEVIGVNLPNGDTADGRRLTYRKDKGIRAGDLDFGKGVVWLKRTKLKNLGNQGIEITMVPMNEFTRPIFERRYSGKAPDALIFTHPDGRPIFTIYKAFRAFVCRFGLVGRDGRGHRALRLQFRDLRKTAAVTWCSAGVSNNEVSKLMGHTTTKTTETVYLPRLNREGATGAKDKIEAKLKDIFNRKDIEAEGTPFDADV